jgi:hypothetical protein
MKFVAALSLVLCAAPSSLAQLDEATCVSQFTTLNADSTIVAEYANIGSAIEANVTDNFLGFCNLLELSCAINGDDYSADFNAACEAAGGQVTTKSLSLSCTGSLGTIQVPDGFAIDVENWPVCVGAACDPKALPQEIEQAIDASVNDVISQIEAGLNDAVMCETLSGGGDTGSTEPITTDAPGGVDTTVATGSDVPTDGPGGEDTTVAPGSDVPTGGPGGVDTTVAPGSDVPTDGPGGVVTTMVAPTDGKPAPPPTDSTPPSPTASGSTEPPTASPPTMAPPSSAYSTKAVGAVLCVSVALVIGM